MNNNDFHHCSQVLKDCLKQIKLQTDGEEEPGK